MARLVERILTWVAALVTLAAIIAVAINFIPGSLGGLRWPSFNANGRTPSTTIDLAEQAVTQGDNRRALDLAGRAVSENGGDAVIANRAGNVALRAGDANAAEKYYLLGESDDRGYPWNYVALGQLYERQGKKELADEQLRAASVAAPQQSFIHYDLGVVEMEEGLYAAALADFEAELKRSPTYKPAMVGRAEALEKLGRNGEALASYQRAGVNPKATKATRPKLTVAVVVQPSPSPNPSPSPSPSAKLALASPTPHPKPRAKKAKAPALPVVVAKATSSALARPPWATSPPSPQSSTVAAAPQASVKPLSEVSADARGYLLDVAQDIDFTRALPSGDPSQSTAALRSSLTDALAKKPIDVESLLQTGTSALLSGRIELASAAFNAASEAAPHDWRGPYFSGLTSQAGGDAHQALSYFWNALMRGPRAETYTSLALVELQNGDGGSAASYARRAVEMTPSYEPGRFVAGMIDLIQSDLRGAQVNLTAAQELGGAPARTASFISELNDIVGASGVSGG